MNLVYYILLLTITNLAFYFIFSHQIKMEHPLDWSFALYHIKLMPVYALLNILTGLGYLYGQRFFGSLTLSVASSNLIKILTLLVVAFLVLHEVPSWKTYIGLLFILIGVVIAK